MKKIIMVIIFSLFLAGCVNDNSKSGIIECKLDNEVVKNNYTLDANYKIHYKGSIVEKVETEEIISSDNNSIIESFESKFSSTYKLMDLLYGGYTHYVETTVGKVTSSVTIDYTTIDMDKLIEDQQSMKNLVNKDNKISVKKLKQTYEAMGMICK